ncbi:MAG: sel1 repeat family protein [Hyphomicrobiales bacterium]|nr:sel1 repeat family protein [Hyphomicrobiales bacterium]
MKLRRFDCFVLAAVASLGFFVWAGSLQAESEAPAQANLLSTQELTADEAFALGVRAYRDGHMSDAVTALETAAAKGHAGAMWKLGRMYSDGDGTEENDLKAFKLYERLALEHGGDSPFGRYARIISDSFVALGQFYVSGIPETVVHSDPRRAVELFRYAATYFGDANAQYELARLYLKEDSNHANPMRAARWLTLAAKKNHSGAQALLGHMLWTGEEIRRRPVQGLAWLILARDNAAGQTRQNIIEMAEEALAEADPADAALAEARAEALRKRVSGAGS